MQKYVLTVILPGLYKAVVELQIVNVNLKPATRPFLFPNWHMDP